MKFSISTCSILIGAILGAAPSCFAQQSSASSTAPSASTTAPASSGTPANASSMPAATPATTQAPPASADKSAPSAELVNRAKSVGMHPETHHGQTVFCHEDASLGSRFTTKKCYNENELDAYITQREAAKSVIQQTLTGASSR
jgi:hypothetical protein